MVKKNIVRKNVLEILASPSFTTCKMACAAIWGYVYVQEILILYLLAATGSVPMY